MSLELASSEHLRPVGLRDIPLALVAPRRVMSRVEDVAGYGWPLVVLLVAVSLIGYATVQTGLIDREVDRGVQESIARLEREQLDVVERSALSKMIEEARKQGEFQRLMMNILAVAIEPIRTLASVLLIAAMFYGLVALAGRKPEWNTLLTICVFASFADLLGRLAVLVMCIGYHTMDVETSLAVVTRSFAAGGAGVPPQATAALSGVLSAVDPFRIWFWIIMIGGLSATAQLRGWKLWGSCCFFWMAAAGMRTLAAVAGAGGPPPS